MSSAKPKRNYLRPCMHRCRICLSNNLYYRGTGLAFLLRNVIVETQLIDQTYLNFKQ